MKLNWITTLKSTDHKAAWPGAQVRMHSLSRLLFGRGYDLLPSMAVESALYDTGHISISCRYVRLQSHKQTRFPITQAWGMVNWTRRVRNNTNHIPKFLLTSNPSSKVWPRDSPTILKPSKVMKYLGIFIQVGSARWHFWIQRLPRFFPDYW